MPWFCVHLSPAQVSARKHERLLQAFRSIYEAGRTPPGMFLVEDMRLTHRYRYCLSPNSEVFCYDLIERFEAEIGFPPPPSDSLFLAGDPDASENYLHPANLRQA